MKVSFAAPRQRKVAKLTDEEMKKDIEDDLVNEFGRMKHLAKHLREQLVKDSQVPTLYFQIVSKLNENITGNIKSTEHHTKSLDAFLKMSNELGFMRLLFMGVTAIALFVITVFFIFFTSFFR